MAYNGEAVQQINRYYFRTKTEGDDHYCIINTIMNLMGALPLALWIGFTTLSIIFMLPYTTTLLEKLSLSQIQKAESLMSKLKKAKVDDVQIRNSLENESKCEKEMYSIELKSDVYKKEVSKKAKGNIYVNKVENDKYEIDLSSRNKWKIDDTPLLALSICLNFVLFVFHDTSYVYIIIYARDVLLSDKNQSSGPIISAGISIIIIVITYISAVGICIYKLSNRCSSDQPSLEGKTNPVILSAAVSITVNIIHLVCYFMPYMLLAFIYNPLQTFVTYLVLGVYVMCLFAIVDS